MELQNIYNPHNQTSKEISENFVVRTKEFNDLMKVIREDKMDHPPQHFMIQGQRGTGKTTLLARINHELLHDSKLKKSLLPVLFPEEQYNIRKLFKLWEEIAEYLDKNYTEFNGLADKVSEQYHGDETKFEEKAYEIVSTEIKNSKKKVLLLIDNFGMQLEKFSTKEQQRLREVLLTNNDIRIVAASAFVLESFHDYSKSFYEFFKIIDLTELNQKETIKLLIHLDKTHKSGIIQKIIDEQPGKIEALRRLTNGVPRTIYLLFGIFVDTETGNSIKDLENLLDKVTPLYKHRMDDLPAQQQEIAHHIAMSWDAINVGEIAKKSKMPSKAVSAQLRIMVKNGIIRKIPTSTKNNLYQLAERFFNIWYLMRAGARAEKVKVIWLVKFLEIWCDTDELIERANKHKQMLKSKECVMYEKHAFYLTEALAQLLPEGPQHELLIASKQYLSEKKSEYLPKLSKSNIELKNHGGQNLEQRIDKLRIGVKKGDTDAMFDLAILYHSATKDFKQAEAYYKMAIDKGHIYAMYNLGNLYKDEFKDFKRAEYYYKMAINKGNVDAMNNLSILYLTKLKDIKQAETYLMLAIDKGNVGAMFNLALLYHTEIKDINKAEIYYKKAIEENHVNAMYNLANLYKNEFKDFKQAEYYYKLAIKNGNIEAINNLARMYYVEIKNIKQADYYGKLAIEKGNVKAMHGLAWSYFYRKFNKQEALKFIHKAVTKEKSIINEYTMAIMALWNNEMEIGINSSLNVLNNKDFLSNNVEDVGLLLSMLLAKKQFNTVLNVFKENNHQIKDRYKPFYYALMYIMRKEFPDEYLKMGHELKETVDEILEKIKKLEKDYN